MHRDNDSDLRATATDVLDRVTYLESAKPYVIGVILILLLDLGLVVGQDSTRGSGVWQLVALAAVVSIIGYAAGAHRSLWRVRREFAIATATLTGIYLLPGLQTVVHRVRNGHYQNVELARTNIENPATLFLYDLVPSGSFDLFGVVMAVLFLWVLIYGSNTRKIRDVIIASVAVVVTVEIVFRTMEGIGWYLSVLQDDLSDALVTQLSGPLYELLLLAVPSAVVLVAILAGSSAAAGYVWERYTDS